jgi:D-arabinose 1-dehydrogenase-like Zn-dependent alcohol dehydrogenase
LCGNNRYLGVAVDGGFATHVLVPHQRYLLDYAPLPAYFAGPLMCSGLTAYAGPLGGVGMSPLPAAANFSDSLDGACPA